MKKEQQKSEDYAQLIIDDNLNRIVAEETIAYEDSYIERNYSFEDGAVVRYQWQDFPFTREADTEIYNHKFTLITPPKENPGNLVPGVLMQIDFPRR